MPEMSGTMNLRRRMPLSIKVALGSPTARPYSKPSRTHKSRHALPRLTGVLTWSHRSLSIPRSSNIEQAAELVEEHQATDYRGYVPGQENQYTHAAIDNLSSGIQSVRLTDGMSHFPKKFVIYP